MPPKRLLIIEDEVSLAKQFKWSLGEKYDVTIASDAESAKKLLRSGLFPVATLDLGLPPSPDTSKEGMRLLSELSTLSGQIKIIVITGNSELDTAVKAVAAGAFDFCAKPIDVNILKVILDRCFRMHGLEEMNSKLLEEPNQCDRLCGMIGVAPVMKKLFSMIRKISGNDYPVLISGESGTGKEMVAKAIHELSPRHDDSFTIVNCGAIPENLLESELFGHEKGAFTGAVARKIGKLEQGNRGTIFLDEIGELPLAMQVKILRCLEERTLERVGGNSTIFLDIRIIAATNIDLKKAVRDGLFREDLYFRLNVVPIELPSLKVRIEDIMALAQHFLRKEADALNMRSVSFSPGAIAELSSHDWPGNVRELQNRIRRALSTMNGQIIQPHDLGFDTRSTDYDGEKLMSLQEARDRSDVACVKRALLLTGNNITQAAKLLDISRPTLHDLIKKHEIKV